VKSSHLITWNELWPLAFRRARTRSPDPGATEHEQVTFAEGETVGLAHCKQGVELDIQTLQLTRIAFADKQRLLTAKAPCTQDRPLLQRPQPNCQRLMHRSCAKYCTTLIIAPANISVLNDLFACFIVPLIAVGRF
jgi:hypothetical protein